MYKTTFIVEGTGEFPFDMLRYACCFPLDEGDSRRLVEDGLKNSRRIQLAKMHRDRVPQLAERRWESFGWKILKDAITTRRT